MPIQQRKIDDVMLDQRNHDRRTNSLATLHGALFLHRRRRFRRANDHVNSYQDWHGHIPFTATLLIIVLCFADAFLTTILLSEGAVEMNIFMDWLIRKNLHAFTIVKMTLTGLALVILVMHYNFTIYRYIAVRYVMLALVPVYALLIAHELNMLATI